MYLTSHDLTQFLLMFFGIAGIIPSSLALLWNFIATIRQSDSELATVRDIFGYSICFAASFSLLYYRFLHSGG